MGCMWIYTTIIYRKSNKTKVIFSKQMKIELKRKKNEEQNHKEKLI